VKCSADRTSQYIGTVKCSADRTSQYTSIVKCSADRTIQYTSKVKCSADRKSQYISIVKCSADRTSQYISIVKCSVERKLQYISIVKCSADRKSQYFGITTNVVHFSLNLLRIKTFTSLEHACSSSSDASQTTFVIMLVCYVSWLYHSCIFTVIVVQPPDIILTQYTKCRLCSSSLRMSK
jgi:hypothetical protein